MAEKNKSARARYKRQWKQLLSYTPFVKRRRYEKVVARTEELWRDLLKEQQRTCHELGHLFLVRPSSAGAARYTLARPLQDLPEETCFFVTHAKAPELKPHVVDHVNALIDAGVAVILIANTELDAASIRVPESLAARLSGLVVRENIGYDFAAWAHVYGLANRAQLRRLYLINDSVIGPLDIQAYRSMLRRVRNSSADFMGLTYNPHPFDHLQSYYLVFNHALLQSPVLNDLMASIVNMPTKEAVIDSYEIWLTRVLESKGFRSASMFPKLSTEPTITPDDTLYHWRSLIEIGFPFMKGSVLAKLARDEAQQFLPDRYLPPRE